MAYDKDSLERAIINTVVMLCKNSITYNELTIQGLIAITVDNQVQIVQINDEQFDGADHEPFQKQDVLPPPKRARPMVIPSSRRCVMPMTAHRTAVPRARQQLSFPGLRRGMPRTVQPARRGSSNSLQNRNMFAGDVKQEAFSRPSADVICVESDEESETKFRPRSTGTTGMRVIPKMECEILEMVDSAVNEARVIQHQSNVMFGSYSSDTKPIVSPSMQNPSSAMSLVPWTPTKPRTQHAIPLDRGTPTRPVKSEVTLNLTPTGNVVRSPMRSPVLVQGQSPWKAPAMSPSDVRGASSSESVSETTTWTSVTQTTFVCTTGGCEKRFTTKRAMVRHQKEKHFLDDGTSSS